MTVTSDGVAFEDTASVRPDRPSEPSIAWPPGHSPEAAHIFARNAIEMESTPDRVWALLTDCLEWPRWYRLCSDVSLLRGGPRLDVGAKFRFKTLGFHFEPEVTTFSPPRMLIWSAKGPAGTRGAHAWHIEPTPGGCRVVTEEFQTGFVLRLRRRALRKRLLASHEEWLRSLKELAEAS